MGSVRHELDLQIGETVIVGNRLLTVIDIDDGEVMFRVEWLEHPEQYGWQSEDAAAWRSD